MPIQIAPGGRPARFLAGLLVSLCLLAQLCLPLRLPADLLINEVMTSNGGVIADENGDTPDWIELFNPGPGVINLAGWALSDDTNAPAKWRFIDCR